MSPLTSKDGAFQIVPNYAVEIAYMVSNIEAAYEVARYKTAVTDLFVDYINGYLSIEEVNTSLYEEWPGAFPGLKKDA